MRSENKYIKTILQGVFFLLLACSHTIQAQETIYYVSLNRLVRLGNYDGVRTLSEAKKHGNFGLGSIEHIAAELVLINDTAYQLSADVKTKIMDPNERLPFAAVKFFSADKVVALNKSYSLKKLQNYLDSLLNKNAFAAIRITGEFEKVEYFCYLPQEKPYKPIARAEKKITRQGNISGTLVGFYSPEAAEVINSPVYHFHFINALRNGGGHIQSLEIKNVTIEIDYAEELKIALPDPSIKMNIDLDKPIHY
jgi:acetolactate decarboxylase